MADVTPIKKLLVANRGEIARRIMRTAHDMGISTVAIFAEGDARAPFVNEADTAIFSKVGPRQKPISTLRKLSMLASAAAQMLFILDTAFFQKMRDSLRQ